MALVELYIYSGTLAETWFQPRAVRSLLPKDPLIWRVFGKQPYFDNYCASC